MLTAVMWIALGVAPPPPSPPPPPPSVDAPVVEEAPAAAADAPHIATTKVRLVEPPSYVAPGFLTAFGTLGTVTGIGMLVWGATLLGSPFSGLGPALGIALGSVFLVTGLVLGAIGVFGIILTMAEKREYRLRLQEQTERTTAFLRPDAPMVVARF